MALNIHCDTSDWLLAHSELIDIHTLIALYISREWPSAECNFISIVLAQSRGICSFYGGRLFVRGVWRFVIDFWH